MSLRPAPHPSLSPGDLGTAPFAQGDTGISTGCPRSQVMRWAVSSQTSCTPWLLCSGHGELGAVPMGA